MSQQVQKPATDDRRVLKESVAEYVREASKAPKFTPISELSSEPFSLEAEAALALLTEMRGDDEFADIVVLRSEKAGDFVYSSRLISDNYAEMMLLKEECDPVRTIIHMVRTECRVYPRPCDLRLFGVAPFSMAEADINAAVDAVLASPDGSDIGIITASTGQRYLYSTKYMGRDWAESLVEWEEVGRHENP